MVGTTHEAALPIRAQKDEPSKDVLLLADRGPFASRELPGLSGTVNDIDKQGHAAGPWGSRRSNDCYVVNTMNYVGLYRTGYALSSARPRSSVAASDNKLNDHSVWWTQLSWRSVRRPDERSKLDQWPRRTDIKLECFSMKELFFLPLRPCYNLWRELLTVSLPPNNPPRQFDFILSSVSLSPTTQRP